jgi:hypothetical protein
MKKLFYLAIIIGLGALALTSSLTAQEKTQRFEYAIVKWDGPDRLYYNLPDQFKMVHLEETGTKIPKEAQNEEFCLAAACNEMAKTGWEPVNLDSRRIVFRRAIAK